MIEDTGLTRMHQPTSFRLNFSFALGLVVLLTLPPSFGAAHGQDPSDKPLLIIKVENEGDSLTRPDGVSDLTAAELSSLMKGLKRDLSKIFTVAPESDKRDCIELGVSIEKLSLARQTVYVASRAVAVGKGDTDLFLTHDAVVQPSLERVQGALVYQMSSMVLQSQLRGVLK